MINYDDQFSSDSSLEFPVVLLSHVDARRYLYSNGESVTDVADIVQH